MTYTKATDKAQRKWVSANYDSIKFTAPKGFKERLKESAEKNGTTMRKFIIEAIEEKMSRI